MPIQQRFRQAHLDFHTGAACEDVGADFDASSFAGTLQAAHVNSINLFAKCCYGYSYYPTQVGTQHPHLKFDLLGRQIEALHRVDIRCPIYISVKWDDLAAIQHPEWVCVNKEGQMLMRKPLANTFSTWSTLDLSSSYSEYVVAQVEELFQRYGEEIDGFWFDICFPMPNYSPWGQAHMLRAKVNLEDDEAVWTYARQQDLKFFERMTRLIGAQNPQATVFYNGTITNAMGEMLPYMSQFEVESDPVQDYIWGYMHFPVLARQARTYGKEFVALTGRFHRSWSDFGGLKAQDQLDYEAGTILAAGGRICIGDQLHPRGMLDAAAYRTIGKVFARVEQLEPWLIDATPAAELAILDLGQGGPTDPGVGKLSAEVDGAAQALLEIGRQFDVVDHHVDLSRYPALVLPHAVALDDGWRSRLADYLRQGGKLVLSGTAALDPASGQFALNEIPVEWVGPAPTVPSFMRLEPALVGETELATDYDYVFYDQQYLVRPKPGPGITGYGNISRALFTRTWQHLTGHRHAGVGESLNTPVIVQSEQVLYLAAPLFTAYRNYDYWVYRAILQNALRNFLDPALLLPGGPGWVEFTLHSQAASRDHLARKIVHLVAFQTRRTFQPIPHADQSWPISGLWFKLRAEQAPSRVYLAPDEQSLPFRLEAGYLRVDLPAVGTHTVIVVEG